MSDTPYFSPALFNFLRELKTNNNRLWFQANKARYERDVRQPVLRFIADFAPYLEEISPHFVADPRPVGGSMFRIYRDVRFSRDKSPYKTHVGIQFRHEMARDAYTPGFYLHLEPGEVLAAAGTWHPDSKSLINIRTAIVEHPEEWEQAIAFTREYPEYQLGGESLKRAPRGFAPGHPLVEDLKRKDFYAVVYFDESAACGPDFLSLFAQACRTMAPLMRFLCKALGLAR